MTHAYGLPENPTPQSIFDKVATHLFEQGRPALGAAGCSYRGADDTACAVGCLITDEQYNPRMEGKFVFALSRDFSLEGLEPFKHLLDGLQDVHDRREHRNEDETFNLERVATELLAVAKGHKLKPYAALRITEAEYDALLKAREILARPELPEGFRFDMSEWVRGTHDCGTVCCIGGTMGLLMADAFEVVGGGTHVSDLPEDQRKLVHFTESHPLTGLFYPSRGGGSEERPYSDYTREQGVQAIDEFLAGKRQPWAFSNV